MTRWPRWLAIHGAALLIAPSAQAVLGAAQDTVQADQLRFQGRHHQHSQWPMTVHDISLPDGSGIRQFVNPAGQVFAVSWHTRLKPDLAALLGAHYPGPDALAGTPQGIASARQRRSMRRSYLVLHQGGRVGAFAGLAYVPALVPQGVDADALR